MKQMIKNRKLFTAEGTYDPPQTLKNS